MLNTEMASKKIGVAPNTLAKWRIAGTGPRFRKLGSKVAYTEQDIEDWLQSRTVSSTSQKVA